MSITITAVAKGSLEPPKADYPKSVINGDFRIEGNPKAPAVGDGVDEGTYWTFDFTSDPQYGSFFEWFPITSALLTLTLTPKNADITTDAVRIDHHLHINTPLIQGLPVDQTTTVVLELLNWYSSTEILGWLFDGAGRLEMNYGDDAIVSFAQLELTQPQTHVFQYAVKIVCGQESGRILVPGAYRTAVNVHNPTYRTIEIHTKVAVALPGEPGPVSEFREHRVLPDGAIEFDCDQIWHWAGIDIELLKGFFVIESDAPLDVVAVYTAGSKKGEVASIHTERVPPRLQRRE